MLIKKLKSTILCCSLLSLVVSNVNATNSYMNINLSGNKTIGSDTISIGKNAIASENQAIAIGKNSLANHIDATAVGQASKATGQNSTALGLKAKASNTNATAIGYNSNATGMSSTALGSAAQADGYTSLALGYTSSASAFNSIAIGSGAKSTTNDGIAIGTRTEVSQLYSIALGDGARATGETLKDAAYLVKDDGPVGELNIGKYSGLNSNDKSGERRITGLAAGSHDTDAVNVSQLKHVDNKVKTLEGKTQNLSDRTDILEEADKLNVKYTVNSQNSTIELLGNDGTVISNVANGKVESDSSEAINGSQLYSTKQALIDYTDTKFDSFNGRLDQLDNRFNKFNKETKAGIASAIAIASLPQPTEKGYSMLSLGTGVWEGETSFALGAAGVTNDKKLLQKSVNYVWKFASTTNSQSNWGGGGSVGVQWK